MKKAKWSALALVLAFVADADTAGRLGCHAR